MIDKAIFKLPGIHGTLAAVLLLSLLRAFCVVGQALGLANAIVNLWGGGLLADQALWIALFFACFVLRQLVLSVQSSLLDRYSGKCAADLRDQLLGRVFTAGPALVQGVGSASVVQTVVDGIEDVRIYLGLIVPKIVAVVIVPLVLLLAIFPLDWISGVIALVCFPFIILYMVMIGHTAQDDAARRHGEFQRMANHFMDSLSGIDELKAFGQSKPYESRIFAASERFREMTMKTLRIATLSSTVLDMFATLALAGVAVMLGFRLVEGSMEFLPALAVLIMVPEYFRPIREFASDYHASLDGRSAFAAIRSVLERAEENEKRGAINDGGDCAFAAARADERVAGASSHKAPLLEFNGVGFSYSDHKDALCDVSFSVQGPCKVGVIGASGSGKSTLLSLLGGFFDPVGGRVSVDGAAALTLRCQQWQTRASFIPQDPYIFHATLRENVAFYCPEASDEQVLEAISLAGLDELVSQLPDGMDTMIGQGARALSGGQAHRVALARAFLVEDRDVLLLDEPTAHLDIETELELKERIIPLMEDKLVFFATHRLHWMSEMDYVIEIESGRIAWQGSAEEWHARHGVNPMDVALEGRRINRHIPAKQNATVNPPSLKRHILKAWAEDTWVKPFFTRYWRVLALALALGLIAAAFSGALMFTSGYMISLAATLPFTVLAVHVPSLYVRIFGVGKPALSYLERLVSHDWALRMTSELRRRLYQVIESAPVASRSTKKMGEVLGLLAEDIEHVQNLYLRTVFPLAIAWLLYMLVVVALGLFSGALALAMALLLGIVVFVLPAVSVCVNGARLEKAKAVKAQLYADLADNVLGVADWVYSGRAEDYLGRYAKLQQEADAIEVGVARFNRWRDVFAQVTFGVAAVVLLVWAASAFAPANPAGGLAGALAAITPENAVAHAGNWIAAFVLCLFPLIESFSPASEAAMGLVTYGDSIERMNRLSKGEGSAPEKDASIGCSSDKSPSVGNASCEPSLCGAETAPVNPVPAICFENVSFTYGSGAGEVLSGFDLRVSAGQRIAVLGRSGAGKSTMASLVRGERMPSSGSVFVAGISADSLGAEASSVVGVIRQDPHLFNWTLRENLALAKPSATDGELAEVLEKVGLGTLLERLPNGLDTMVDERGRRFSGGERHRIALARVLLANTPIVVLDEPFAGLDPDTEQALIDVMFRTLEGRTVVMITHHLQGVAACDRVIFLEEGRVAIDGAPTFLAGENARYRHLLAVDLYR